MTIARTRKTAGDKIDELEKLVATLTERLDYTRRELIDSERFAVVEERLNELKKAVEETGRKGWSLLSVIVGATVGGIIGSVLTFALSQLKK